MFFPETNSVYLWRLRTLTGPPGDHGALHRPRTASTTTLRFFSLPPRGVLQWLEEQSWSGCGESGSFAGQSQHQRLQHRSSPGSFVTVFARLPHRLCPLSQFAHATRTLVRGGPTRPHRPRLVASHSTRPLSSLPPPPRTAFTYACSNKQQLWRTSPGPALPPQGRHPAPRFYGRWS